MRALEHLHNINGTTSTRRVETPVALTPMLGAGARRDAAPGNVCCVAPCRSSEIDR